MALHADRRRASGVGVRADALESTSDRCQLHHRRDEHGRDHGDVHRRRNAEPDAASEPRQASGRRTRYAARVPEHGAVEQGVGAECRDDRIEQHAADQEAVQQAGGDRREEGDADRRHEPGVDAVRVVRQDHDVEREPTGDGEVDAALHDHQRLAERRDRERRRKRQHREQHAPAQARRREHAADCEQHDGRNEDRRESTGQQACRPSRNRVLRLGRTAPVRFGAHVVGDSNAYNSRSQGVIKFQFLLCDQPGTVERWTALDTAETLCMMRFLSLQGRARTLSTLTYDCVSLLNNQRCERRKRRPEPTGDEEERAG